MAHDNADFYLGLGKYARYLGSIRENGDIAYLDGEYDLFGFDITASEHVIRNDRPPLYTEADYLSRVEAILGNEDGRTQWPWNYGNSRGTRYAYTWNNGNLTVFVHGRQLAMVYPNLARGDAVFPEMPPVVHGTGAVVPPESRRAPTPDA